MIIAMYLRMQSDDPRTVRRFSSRLPSLPRRHTPPGCEGYNTRMAILRAKVHLLCLRLLTISSESLPGRTRLLRQRPLNLSSHLRGIRQRLSTPPLPDLLNDLINHLVELDTRIQRNSQCGASQRLQTLLTVHRRPLSASLELMLDPPLAGRKGESAADRDTDDGVEPDGGPCADAIR